MNLPPPEMARLHVPLRRRYSESEIDAFVGRFLSGETMLSIARSAGFSKETFRRILAAKRIPSSLGGGGKKRRESAERLAQMVAQLPDYDSANPLIVNPQVDLDWLRKNSRYDQETGAFWLRGKLCDRVSRFGYLLAYAFDRTLPVHRLVWLYVHGELPKHGIDHINGQRTDNRLANLRLATPTQQRANTRVIAAHGFKGAIAPRGEKKLWGAAIKFRRKRIWLGSFTTPEQAHAAYMSAARELFGEYARAA